MRTALLRALAAALLLGCCAASAAPTAPGPGSSAAAPGSSAPAAAATKAPAPAAVRARTFTIRYRNAGDVALLVQPLLSQAGSYTLQPALKTLTVQDTETVLARVAEVVASFDVPPRNVEITINLLLGSQDKKESQSLPREVRGITDILPDITKWTNLQVIDSVSFTGSEGGRTTRTLGNRTGTYQIDMGIESVDDQHGVIRIEPFIVSKEIPPATPGAPTPGATTPGVPTPAPAGTAHWKQEYASRLNLKPGVLLTVVAARSAQSERALFLTIRARVLE